MDHLIHFLWLISSAVVAIFFSISDPITPVHCLVVYIRLMGQIYNFPCLIYFSTRRSRSVLLKGFFRIGALRLKPKKILWSFSKEFDVCVRHNKHISAKIIYKPLIIKKNSNCHSFCIRRIALFLSLKITWVLFTCKPCFLKPHFQNSILLKKSLRFEAKSHMILIEIKIETRNLKSTAKHHR